MLTSGLHTHTCMGTHIHISHTHTQKQTHAHGHIYTQKNKDIHKYSDNMQEINHNQYNSQYWCLSRPRFCGGHGNLYGLAMHLLICGGSSCGALSSQRSPLGDA